MTLQLCNARQPYNSKIEINCVVGLYTFKKFH